MGDHEPELVFDFTREEPELSTGISFHFARQTGQMRFPCFTFDVMQLKWKECEHSAVKMAWPFVVFIVVKHIAQILLDDDLMPYFDIWRPEDEGVGAVGIRYRTSELLREREDGDGDTGDSSSSVVLGT